ncbi:MAG: CDP-glycerol glycerophosphotransferase family protein [Microbacterium sp.]
MASFSFRAGNAAKLLRAPLYALGRLVTLLVPRGERWVFGCGAGIGDGPLEVWRVAQEDGVAAVWLVTDDAEAREAAAIGIPTIRRDSWRGFWATVRARVVVVAFGLGDVNPYGASGAFVVQLWHGIPLKRIGMDSSETTRSPVPFARSLVSALLAFAYARSARRIDLMPASHHLIRGRLESAFELPHGRVLVTGEPRVDPLSTGDAHARRARARRDIADAAGEIPDGAPLVLYAPTWRDGAADPAVPSAQEWALIRGVLERHGVESAFELPHGRVLVTGEPRVDPLSTGDAHARRARARRDIADAAGEIPDGAPLVLYAPTWRDGAADPAVPSAQEWALIRGVLERHGAILLVRSHRLGAGSYEPPFETPLIRDLGAERLRDITPALAGCDALITDYSSLAFDAALVPLPVVYFAPDAEEYAATRGLYGRYEAVAGDDYARDWSAAAERLDRVLGDSRERDALVARSEALSERVHAYCDGGNARRVYDAVRARVDQDEHGRRSAARIEGTSHG